MADLTSIAAIIGETITTHSGSATITRTQTAGSETIIFADYGSGIEQPHISDSLLSPEQPTLEPPPPQRRRRHSPKGKASGWIEERTGNRKRKNPSLSYYYCWQQGTTRGKQYIPARKLATVRDMLEQRCSVGDVLQLLDPDTPRF